MEDDIISCCEGACDPVAMASLNQKTLLEIIVRNAPKSSLSYGLLKGGDENRKPRSLAQVSEHLFIIFSRNYFFAIQAKHD